MRILVTGGRVFSDVQTLRRIMGWLNPSEVCQGGAQGADLHAKHWADDNGVPVRNFNAEWDKYGRSAGPIRNEKMLKEFKPDAVVAFPGGSGTKHMITIAERDGYPVYETCFVFGSNLAGRHGKGAAKTAKDHWQAQYGMGAGPTGWAYAIPTKGMDVVRRLELGAIAWFIGQFIRHAETHPKNLFFVTAVGTGLAGYKREDIEPFFYAAPGNCLLPMGWNQSARSPSLVEVRAQTPVSAGSNPAGRTNNA